MRHRALGLAICGAAAALTTAGLTAVPAFAASAYFSGTSGGIDLNVATQKAELIADNNAEAAGYGQCTVSSIRVHPNGFDVTVTVYCVS